MDIPIALLSILLGSLAIYFTYKYSSDKRSDSTLADLNGYWGGIIFITIGIVMLYRFFN